MNHTESLKSWVNICASDYSLDCHSIFMIKHDSVSTPLVDPAASFELPDSPPSYFTIFGIN